MGGKSKVWPKIFASPLFLPFLFLLSQYKVIAGIQTLTADTGDGFAAFKFTQFLPVYWNWYENTGQPFLFDIAVYRLLDPLLWPLLLVVKSLPVPLLIQYNLFQLLRIALLGVGMDLLFKELKYGLYERRLMVVLCLFGSFAAAMFRSVGMIDLMSAFIFLSLGGLKFLKTRSELWLIFIAAIFINSALSYHILYVLPMQAVFFGLWLYGSADKISVWETLHLERGKLLFCSIVILGALGAAWVVSQDPLLIPALRNMRYNTVVDEGGRVQTPGLTQGRELLNRAGLSGGAEACNTQFPCREYQLSLLDSFYQLRSYFSLTGFISIFALLTLLGSVFFWRSKRVQALWLFTALSFVLSLGSQTPLWPLWQKFFPFLNYVRHTGFFISLFLFSSIMLFGYLISQRERLLGMMPKPLGLCCCLVYFLLVYRSVPPAFLMRPVWSLLLALGLVTVSFLFWRGKIQTGILFCLLLECFLFQRTVAESFKDFTTAEQLKLTQQTLPKQIQSRQLRVLNDFSVPRSSAATGYGIPSALEPVHRPDEKAAEVEARYHNLLLFGHFTPFLLAPYVQARLYFSSRLPVFERVFGVAPYPVVSIYSGRRLDSAASGKKDSLDKIDGGSLLLDAPLELIQGLKSFPIYDRGISDGLSLKIEGENLSVEVEKGEGGILYVAVPYEAIHTVLMNGTEKPFYKANHFGVGIPLGRESGHLELKSQVAVKRLFCLLFYGSYGLLGGFLVLSLYRRHSKAELIRIVRACYATFHIPLSRLR